MRPTRAFLLAVAAACAAFGPALAQSSGVHSTMPGMSGATSMPTNMATAQSQADQEMMQAMTKMDRDMSAAKPSGNTDQDFVAMMIPHHQGAIDMAEVELKYGKDLTLRRLATSIISAQKMEIKEMHAWQAGHHPKP